jgi:predicted nucleic acid-binding protein
LTLYLEPCVLLACLTPEAHTDAAIAFLAGADEPLAVSNWCETELTSALGIKIRTNQLTADQAEAVLLTYRREMALAFEHFTIDEQDFLNANGCLRGWSTALRAADALHLAIAAGRDATLGSLDRTLVEAAWGLGFAARLIPTD